MKKVIKCWIPVLLSCALLCLSILPVYADEQPTPRFTNTQDCVMSFYVNSNGANFAVTYMASEATFLEAKLTVTVEKKVLGLFWNEVSTWSGYCYDRLGYLADTLPANGKGTYRATFRLIVYGNQGIADVIDDTIEVRYTA